MTDTALLLANLGSPSSTEVKDIKKFLTDFLMDKRVMDFPYLFRAFLVKGIIVPRRAKGGVEPYKSIWRADGSPLIVLAEKLKNKIQEKVDFPVGLCMRYGKPSTKEGFREILKRNPKIKKVVVLPLYPHYTMSSFDTAVEEIYRVYKKEGYKFRLEFMNPFYNHPDYINVLVETIRPHLNKDFDKVLFSYHGIPERHLQKDDHRLATGKSPHFKLPKENYQEEAKITSALTAEKLGIPKEKYEVSFQSRLAAAGKEWIKPYTANRLAALPGEGVKKLLVVCPAFINDCLETIEEIGSEGRETFEHAGGTEYDLVPCINDHDSFADVVIKWVENGQ